MADRKQPFAQGNVAARCYTICSFDRGLIVPKVHLIDAETDEDAVASAQGSDICSVREVWDRHRLVAVIQPLGMEAAEV